jgi:cation:H+ antiporter
VGLATLANLPPAVIGLTVVAAGTSVPELAVSVAAAIDGKVDITVGNVVGSNTFNLAFILGVSALIAPLVIGGNTVKLEYPVLILVTLLCVAACGHGTINRLDGVLFLAIYVGFVAYLVSLVRARVSPAEAAQFKAETEELTTERAGRPRLWAAVVLVALGVALLAGGAELTVRGASALGRAAGLSDLLIGLLIIAPGTGLPELVTSVVSSVRGRNDVAIGNVVGSNLFNVLVILGANALVAPLPIAPEIAARDTWWMLGVTVGVLPLMATGLRISRWEGAALFAAYGVYMAVLLA